MIDPGPRTNSSCGVTLDQVNHAVVVVGYGVTAESVPYWIIKVGACVGWSLERGLEFKSQ